MSVTEILGFVTGALCVVLVIRRNIWNWPAGLANNGFYLVLFFQAGLYADAGLQIVYLALGAYGWWAWLHGGVDRSPLDIRRTLPREAVVLVTITVVGTLALAILLRSVTDSTVPLADGLTTTLSLVAQWMLTRKLLENWWVWIVADVLYVGLYIYKDLRLTAVLYAVFLVLCVLGLRAWRRVMPAEAETPAALATA
jgi:nicotinamide mononucleotide transporter